MAGETFEITAPETAEIAGTNGSSGNTSVAAGPEEGAPEARPRVGADDFPLPIAPRTSRAPRSSGARGASNDIAGSPGAVATPGLYGAVGERSAADLATAFTRGLPQAASADPIWRSSGLGSAGEAEVVLKLDESGHIESAQVAGSPSPALSSAIHRTLSLIKGRPFVARSKTTRLQLRATIAADTVHDGLHGDVFAIGGSFAGGEGNAFFALAIGRRIDVQVRSK